MTDTSLKQQAGLNGNALKLLAAFSMLLDHIGVTLFPYVLWLRVAGRLALPIYAYMIAEGCHYTKNRLRYFLMVFGLGAACQVVYALVMQDYYMCILITFSLSILMIFCLELLRSRRTFVGKLLGGALFAAAVAATWWLNRVLEIDYGFWGCMLPVFPALLRGTEKDSKHSRVLMLALGLLILSVDCGGIQILSLAAIPVLLLYNEQRGRLKLKYFFYIFYPLHLVILQGIAWLMAIMK